MSRYLEYARADEGLGVVRTIPSPPAARCPVVLAGHEASFRSYLRDSYEGGSYVFCGGRIVAKQVLPNVVLTLVMTLYPAVHYFTHFLTRLLAPTPLWDSMFGRSQIILGIVVILLFVLASFTDPGIIPRNHKVPKEFSDHLDVQGEPSHRFLRISGITVKQRFCRTCLILRPPRSKHCSICDNCVLRFDHHCNWLGNCIGLHNYRYFVCLLYAANIFLFFTTGGTLCLFFVINKAENGEDAGILDLLSTVANEPHVLSFLLYCVFLLFALLTLAIYHTVIITQNRTTNEHIKNYWKENPFDFGALRNCWQIWCHPERVLALGNDQIEADYVPLGSYHSELSIEDGECGEREEDA